MRISVITPSFNQARFIRHTIDSVLAQGHADLEYWVIDGGSSDGTIDILRSYGERINWVSERDRGQSHAINKGLGRATGDVVCWLNSDDVFLPGCLANVERAFADDPALGLAYGDGRLIDEYGGDLGIFQATEDFDFWRLVNVWDYILQPSAFFRSRAVRAVGGLDETLHFTMDWDLWIRLALNGPVRRIPGELACSREYGATKTASGGWRRFREIAGLMRRHGARRAAPGMWLYGSDTIRKNWLGVPLLGRLADAVATSCAGHAHRSATSRYPDGWAGPACDLWIPARDGATVEVVVTVHDWFPHLDLDIAVGGRWRRERLQPGRHVLPFLVPASGGALRLCLRTDRYLVPAEVNGSADRRKLSYQVEVKA